MHHYIVLMLVCFVLATSSGICGDIEKTFGEVSRKIPDTQKIVISPVSGKFSEDEIVEMFNGKGEAIGKGVVKSVYKDSVYVELIDEETYRSADTNCIVGVNLNQNDIYIINDNYDEVTTINGDVLRGKVSLQQINVLSKHATVPIAIETAKLVEIKSSEGEFKFNFINGDMFSGKLMGLDEVLITTGYSINPVVVKLANINRIKFYQLDEISGSNQVELIDNGGFEEGELPHKEFITVYKGENKIKNWNIVEGSIDYVSSYWNASEGRRSIDLSGVGNGRISQTIKTEKGKLYELSFDLSGNPDDKNIKIVNVYINNEVTEYKYSAKNTRNNMEWEPKSLTFKSTSTSTVVEFESARGNPTGRGPVVDNIKIYRTGKKHQHVRAK